MLSPELEADVLTLLRALAAECKECLRGGSSCSTCWSNEASQLVGRITAQPQQVGMKKSKERDEAVLTAVRGAGRPVLASEIKVDGCSASLKSMILIRLKQRGFLKRICSPRKRPMYVALRPNG